MDTTPRGISKAQLNGIASVLAEALAEQRQQFEAHTAQLEARIAALEAFVLGVLAGPNATPVQPPADGTPAARH